MLKLQAFGTQGLKTTVKLLAMADAKQISTAELVKQVEAELNRRLAVMQADQPAKNNERCSQCGKPVRQLPVNDRPATMAGGDYTHVLLCDSCLHCEYITRIG